MDCSINSIDESDLNECFSGLKQQLGNHLQRTFINHIYHAQTSMVDNFKNICQSHQISEKIRQIQASSSANSGCLDSDSHLNEISKKIKREELEWLQNDVERLNKKILKLRESSKEMNKQLEEALKSSIVLKTDP